MSNLTIPPRILSTWVCAGVSDVLTLDGIDPFNYFGVQLDTDLINLETATITVTKRGGLTQNAPAEAGTGNSGVVGEGWSIAKITISNVPAGTYKVVHSQPPS